MNSFTGYLKKAGYSVRTVGKKKTAKHIFTHIEWRMSIYHITLDSPVPDNEYVWVTREELFRDYAVPAAYQGALNLIKKEGK